MSAPLQKYLEDSKTGAIKLHLGCGGVRWKDFINVDLFPAQPGQVDTSRDGCVADVFADVRNLGLPDGVVDEIFTSHTVEHFTRWVALDMMRDWYRMLKPGGGVMVVEMPDFWRCIAWLFHPSPKRRKVARSQFYGNQWDRLDFETHRYVWSASEFKRELLQIGFARVDVSHRVETHFRGRDMRVVAYK